jgi:hypothetical protein
MILKAMSCELIPLGTFCTMKSDLQVPNSQPGHRFMAGLKLPTLELRIMFIFCGHRYMNIQYDTLLPYSASIRTILLSSTSSNPPHAPE